MEEMIEMATGCHLPMVVPTSEEKEALLRLKGSEDFQVFGRLAERFYEEVQDRLVISAGSDVTSNEYAKLDVYLGQFAVCRMLKTWFS